VLSLLFDELTVEDILEERFQDGIEEGVEKGKLETALKMLDDGILIENIIKWTCLNISILEKAINQRSLPN
jgi:predicted transposase YdaD